MQPSTATSSAVLLTLEAFGSREQRIVYNLARDAAGSDVALIAIPLAAADQDAVRTACEPLGFTVVDPPSEPSFAAAANAGARSATSDVLFFVGRSEPRTADWVRTLSRTLASHDAGVIGPRVVTEDGSNEEYGLIVVGEPLTIEGFRLQAAPPVRAPAPCDAFLSECIGTRRSLFEELGGFTETFDDARAAADYCLRAGVSGRSVVVEPAVAFGRLASARANEVASERAHREYAFAKRWRERARRHENFWPERTGSISRLESDVGVLYRRPLPTPRTTVLVHGEAPASADAFVARLYDSRMKPDRVVWGAAGAPPDGLSAVTDACESAAALTERRGADYVAFVRADTVLARDWLSDLVSAIEQHDTVAATVAPSPADDEMPACADARCTLVKPQLVPAHVRIEAAASLDAAVAAWLGWAAGAGRTIVSIRNGVGLGAPAITVPALGRTGPSGDVRVADPFVSIVMLSYNAVEYTERAIESIRARTTLRHEIIIVDNGSNDETRRRLTGIGDIRLILNACNTGFSYGCNQGLAAARGEYVVLLNNDVLVTDGWLEAMIAVQLRNPTVGCCGPRSNSIAGRQLVDPVAYRSTAALPVFAAQRAIDHRGRWMRRNRIVGFCLCLNRRVVDEIGGLDPRYGIGNFEDDDYCMRIRAAGYEIAICDDSFIHHFGSVSFKANDVDYMATFARNQLLFSERWGVTLREGQYDSSLPWRRGFDRERDYVPLPEAVGVGADWTAPA